MPLIVSANRHNPSALQHERFVRAMAAALMYAKAEDDANPDVGMSPTLKSLLDRVCASVGLVLTPREQDDILIEARQRFPLR